MNVFNLNTQKINDVGNLSKDPDTKGFDLQAGQSWIYPTNYPIRDYQYNITEQALFKNTLVSLPTGLGKTFIAAVVMYNFYRWYPHNKIIFMAPTRPLVKQQLDACYNITAIPAETTAELTGTKIQQSRAEIWESKRVFFITPQVLQNDLPIIIELGAKIKCLVFDEAHRAKGNHAYCEVIRKLLPKNRLFRVLALSATPGNSSRDVIEVMQNLLIAHLEFRSEDSPDVKPYVFERALETVVVPLGDKLQQVKDNYMEILETYTRTLLKYKVVYGNCGNLTKGKIFMVMKEFQAKNAGTRNPNYSEIMKTLNICVTLYHAYETLIRCGLRAFLNFYDEHINNPLLRGNAALHLILNDLKTYLGPAPEIQRLPDGTFGKIPADTKFGHPKFYQLREILYAHFTNSEKSTRVIVFFEYRESVTEAYALLSQNHPMIKPRVFVGQGSGVTQRDQINTVKAFRDGICNTLLSTCIGEEGLDVGDVDLIVCFDIASKSPIRMIQRMGRTGRKKDGRVVVLVTEGKEQQTLKECLIYKNSLGQFVSTSQNLSEGKYKDNPSMVPSYIQSKCVKMHITVKKPVITKGSSLKDMLKRMANDTVVFCDDIEIVEINERLSFKSDFFFNQAEPLTCSSGETKINFSKHIENQRTFQSHDSVKRSKQTEIFVGLLQFADSKRYNLPSTQKISRLGDFDLNKNLKQGDIRTMFAKPMSNTLSQEICSINNFIKEKDITRSFPHQLFDEISDYVSIKNTTHDCKTCSLLFECPKMIDHGTEPVVLSTWIQPDLSLLDGITAQDWHAFVDNLNPKLSNDYESLLEADDDIFNQAEFSSYEITENSFSYAEKTTIAYETPRNFDKILESFRLCTDENAAETLSPKEDHAKSFQFETPKSFAKVINSLKSTISKDLQQVMEESFDYETPKRATSQKLLAFFKLSSAADIFVKDDSNNETIIYARDEKRSPIKNTSPDLFESPDLFSEDKTNVLIEDEPGSPILCSYDRTKQWKAKKNLFEQSKKDVAKKPNLSILHQSRKSFYNSPNKTNSVTKSALDINDICDLACFELQDLGKNARQNETKSVQKTDEVANLDISDICDLSMFGLSETNTKLCTKNNNSDKEVVMKPGSQKMCNRELSIDDVCDISSFFADSTSQKTTKIAADTKLDRKLSDLSDFCDFTFLSSPSKNCENIDLTTSGNDLNLTDTNFNITPTQVPSKAATLDLVSSSSDSIQKENIFTPKRTKAQNRNLSLQGKNNVLKMQQTTPKSNQRNNNTPTPRRCILKLSLASDSDDEFEDTAKSSAFQKPKPKVPTHKIKTSNHVKKRKAQVNEFIDNEAVLSEDEVAVSEDEDSGDDCFESSFVNDETQDFHNNTRMQAKYLQSVRSPSGRGKFKIPAKPTFNITNVFSQEVSNEDNTYLDDSFCIDEDVEPSQQHELSELEILEMKLEEMKNRRKRKKSDDKLDRKRRRIIVLSEDSD